MAYNTLELVWVVERWNVTYTFELACTAYSWSAVHKKFVWTWYSLIYLTLKLMWIAESLTLIQSIHELMWIVYNRSHSELVGFNSHHLLVWVGSYRKRLNVVLVRVNFDRILVKRVTILVRAGSECILFYLRILFYDWIMFYYGMLVWIKRESGFVLVWWFNYPIIWQWGLIWKYISTLS